MRRAALDGFRASAERPRRSSRVGPVGSGRRNRTSHGSRPSASSAARSASRCSREVVELDRRRRPPAGASRRPTAGGQRDAARPLAAQPERRSARRQRRRLVAAPRERVERIGAGHARWPGGRVGRHSAGDVHRRLEAVEPLGPIGGRGMPNGTCSPSCQPAPRPRMKRPPSRDPGRSRPWPAPTGWRNVADRTAWPTHRPGRGGRAPRAPSAPRAPAPWRILGRCSVRWSFIQTAVEHAVLADLAGRATSRRASPSRRPAARS